MKISKNISLLLIVGTLAFGCSKKTVQPTAVKSPNTKIQQPAAEKIVAVPFFTGKAPKKQWLLSISTDEIKFASDVKGQSFTLPYVKPTMAPQANKRTYKLAAADRTIEISIEEGSCSDSISKTRYNHIVKVVQKRGEEPQSVISSGCGNYVADAKLNTVWILQELRGKKVVPADFGNELPYIDLHTDISEFTGFAGCNRIKGRLEVFENSVLKFSEVVATKMACLPENKENIFLQALQSTTKTEMQGRLLVLSNSSGIQAILFKKS